MSEWVNRIGLLFDFISFWLVAPEILGEERLRKLENIIENGIRGCGAISTLLATGLLIVLGSYLLGSISAQTNKFNNLMSYVLFCPGLFLLLFLINLVRTTADNIIWRTAKRVLNLLADDSQIRQRSLTVGVVIYILGFIIQFWSSF
jgi:hypothetical protein